MKNSITLILAFVVCFVSLFYLLSSLSLSNLALAVSSSPLEVIDKNQLSDSFVNLGRKDEEDRKGSCDSFQHTLEQEGWESKKLEDFPYKSNFINVLGSQLHYLDVGEGDPILFIHGNASWSYLWRNIIPFVLPQGRAIALDLIGMGKSDKPDIDYTFADHYRYVEAFIETLNLKNITFVVHDWGSALGFHYARLHEKNVKGIAFMEALIPPFFPVENIEQMGEKLATIFGAVRESEEGRKMVYECNIFVEEMLPSSVLRELSETEKVAYRLPFSEKFSRKPTLVWATQIPIAGQPPETEAVIQDYGQWLRKTSIPKLHFYVSPGGSLNPPEVAQWTAQQFPNIETHYLGKGLHYFQEDYPEEIGRGIADWLRRIK